MRPDIWLSKLKTAAGILHGSRAFGGPYQLNLSLTNRCNLRCIHCYFYSPFLEKPLLRPLRSAVQSGTALPDREELKQIQTMDADTERCRLLIQHTLAMGTRRVQFSGNGEAFLHPDAIELMALARRGGAHCIANTNGTLIDRKKADALVEMGFDELRVTVMAGCGDLYALVHPGASEETFGRLTDNLSYLAERKKRTGAKAPKVVAVCIVVAQNAERLREFAEYAARIGADKVLFKPFDDCQDPGLRKMIPTPEQAAVVRSQLEEAKKFLSSNGIRQNVNSFLSVFDSRINTANLYKSIPCYYGWLAVMVELDGNVYTCCRNNRPIGNLAGQTFPEIWHGAAYNEFRRQAKRLPERGTPVANCSCSRCVHHAANFRAHVAMHPVAGRRPGLRMYLDRGFGEPE